MARTSFSPDKKRQAKAWGVWVKALREHRGLTQEELAAISGVERSYIGAIELGRVQVVYPEHFNKLKKALKFSSADLMSRVGYDMDDANDAGELDLILLYHLRRLSAEQQKAFVPLAKALDERGQSA